MANVMKVLVLGGAGFIGSHLAAEFLKEGCRVVVVDGFVRNTGANIKNIESILGDIEFYDCPVERLVNLPELIEESDVIADSMGLTSHLIGMEDPLTDLEINLHSHVRVITSLRAASGKKVLYLGSRGQYGRGRNSSINEDTPQEPLDTQGVSKVAAEHLYRIYAQKFDYNVVSFRITNCFGEHQKTEGSDIGLVGMFIRDILSGKLVEVFGDSKRKKNVLYVKDLTKMIVEFSHSEFKRFEAYNVAGQIVSLEKLLNTIIEVIGKGEYTLKKFPASIRNIDVGEATFVDNRIRFRAETLEQTELRTAIFNTIRYFRQTLTGGEGDNDF